MFFNSIKMSFVYNETSIFDWWDLFIIYVSQMRECKDIKNLYNF